MESWQLVGAVVSVLVLLLAGATLLVALGGAAMWWRRRAPSPEPSVSRDGPSLGIPGARSGPHSLPPPPPKFAGSTKTLPPTTGPKRLSAFFDDDAPAGDAKTELLSRDLVKRYADILDNQDSDHTELFAAGNREDIEAEFALMDDTSEVVPRKGLSRKD